MEGEAVSGPHPPWAHNGVVGQGEEHRVCVVMVGLPARGKSLIAMKGESPASLAATLDELG